MRRWPKLRALARAAAFTAASAAGGPIITPMTAQEHHGAPASAGTVALRGTAACADGSPLGHAVVQLFHADGAARHLMAASLADAAGRFSLEVRAGAGAYTLEIGHPALPGRSNLRQLTLANVPLRVGDLRLECTPRALDAVTVRVDRDALQLRSGATVISPRAAAAAGGSIADLLRTVPGLEVEMDGRLRMRSSASVLVLIDGRRIPLSGDALIAFLRQMPAASLERVETGTAAAARDDASGTGVVNLILRDNPRRRTDLRSLAGSAATADHYMGSAAATGHLHDMLTWDASVSASGMRPSTVARVRRWSLVPGDLPLRADEWNRARESHRLRSIQAGAAVTSASGATLALRGSYSHMAGASQDRSAFVYSNAAGDSGTSAIRRVLDHEIPSAELGAVASVAGSRVTFASEARTSAVGGDFRGDNYDADAGHRYLRTTMASRQRELALRNDLSARLPYVSLDVGHESRFRTATAQHDALHFGATESRELRHVSGVHAGYVVAHRAYGPLRTEAGLRVEAERTRLERVRLDGPVRRDAVHAFPSVRGEWTDAPRLLVYRISLGRRINRPGTEMLNPFSMGRDDINETRGDPTLRPELLDQVELGVERHGERVTWHLTPFLRRTRDPIRPVKSVTTNGALVTTLTNLAGARAVGVDASLRARTTDRATLTLAGSITQLETTDEAFDRRGAYATARVMVDLRVTPRTTAQVYAHGRGAQAVEQGEILPAFTSELSMTQRVAGDRGRLTLRLSDPLRSERLESRLAGASFSQDARRRSARPLLSLFASYAVGGAPREDAPARP